MSRSSLNLLPFTIAVVLVSESTAAILVGFMVLHTSLATGAVVAALLSIMPETRQTRGLLVAAVILAHLPLVVES